MKLDALLTKAAELGFTIQQGSMRYAGYTVFKGDAAILGEGYSASLADIDRFLLEAASDVGLADADGDETLEEVDVNVDKKRVTPPTVGKLPASLRKNDNAAATRNVLRRPPRPTKVQIDDENRRWAAILGHREGWRGFELMSPDERASFLAKAKAARAEEDRIEASKYPEWKPHRTYENLSVDDIAFAEKCRSQNARRRAERLFSETNRSHDVERIAADDTIIEERFIDDVDHRFLAPDARHDSAPKAATDFAITKKPCRLSKDEIQRRRDEVHRASEIDKLAETIKRLVNEHPTPQRDAELGSLLAGAKNLVGRGGFDGFVANLGISRSGAYRFMSQGAK